MVSSMATEEGADAIVKDGRTETVAKLPMTEDDFLRLPDDGIKHELVDGEVTDVPTGGEHGDLGMVLAILMGPHAYKIGRIYGSSTGFRMAGGNVRSPDVSVMRRERLPEGRSPKGIIEGAPDLAVEIIATSENPADAFRKVGEYLDAGAQRVWQIFPDKRQVIAYYSLDEVRTFLEHDILDGGDVVPGFHCRVADLFNLD